MSTAWASGNGVVLADLVPARLRREWVERGYCPDADLYTLFARQVLAHPERAAVVDPIGAVSYSTMDRWVRGVAGALSAAGLGSRDIVGIQIPNGRLAVLAELAVAAIGAVALPLPGKGVGRDVVSLLARSLASAVIVPKGGLAVPRDRLPLLRTVFPLVVGDVDPDWRPGDVDPEAPARILVSSGSEAEPKMVAYSHNAMAGGRAAYVRALSGGVDPMRNMVLVPLASSFGSLGTSVTVVALGGTLLLPESFEPTAALRMITEHRPTHVFGVPTMLRRMTECVAGPGECLDSLRAVVASGAALSEETIEACRSRLGCAVIAVYGSSDGVNCHTALDGMRPDGGAGRQDPEVAEIRIVDAEGSQVPAGEQGEIVSLGPMTPLCYVGAPELDARYRLPG
ncbi:MAG: class I adenylate-forming enzyme family protein, partial [Sciscionella sp.]